MFIHAGSPAGQGGSEVLQSSISPFRMGPVSKKSKTISGYNQFNLLKISKCLGL